MALFPKLFSNPLDFVKTDIAALPEVNSKPSRRNAFQYFFQRTKNAIKLILLEKEIIVFSLLQWLAVVLGYFLWVQMLSWIPDEVWRSTEHSNSGSVADYVLLVWSFLVVGIVALPLSILSACIGAVFFLKRLGKESTVDACLQLVMPKAKSLWFFFWIDGWITVNMILDRLPKKRSTNSIANEALYFAWKLGTIGILPGLISGRDLVTSGKDSVLLVKAKIGDALLLRTGYSFMCWIIGIISYIGAIYFIFAFDLGDGRSRVYTFYLLAGVPIALAVGVIQLILRPIFILASAELYADYLKEQNTELVLPSKPTRVTSTVLIYVVLLIIILFLIAFRDTLGITQLLATPYK